MAGLVVILLSQDNGLPENDWGEISFCLLCNNLLFVVPQICLGTIRQGTVWNVDGVCILGFMVKFSLSTLPVLLQRWNGNYSKAGLPHSFSLNALKRTYSPTGNMDPAGLRHLSQ